MAQTSTATIDGQITNPAHTTGLSGVTVTLTPLPESITHLSQAPIGRTTSRGDGSFHFDQLPSGRFYITASKTGYLEGAFGRLVPSGTQSVLNLAAGAHVSGISIPLWKPSTISGSLLDDGGAPIASNPIQLLQEGYAGGRRLLHARTIVRSDATGFFRFDALTPGTYFLAAIASHGTVPAAAVDPSTNPADVALWEARLRLITPPPWAGMPLRATQIGTFKVQPAQLSQPDPKLKTVFPLTFFPSSQSLSGALPIDLAAEEDRQNADVTVAKVPAVAITGTVIGPSGPVPAAVVRLMPAGLEPVRLTTGFETASAIADAEGSFVMFGVPTGDYVIEAMDRMGHLISEVQGTSLWGSTALAVGHEDISDLAIPVRGAGRLSGRVVFQGATPPPAPASLKFNLEPIEGRFIGPPPLPTSPENDGTFVLSSAPPGRYLLRLVNYEPPGWTLSSAMKGNVDLLDTPFELAGEDVSGVIVTLTDRAAAIAGTVRGVLGSAEPRMRVLAFSTDERHWSNFGLTPPRIWGARVSSDGEFTITGLPAGDYYVAAMRIESPDTALERDPPATLGNLTRVAVRLHLAEHEVKTISLERVGNGK